MTLNNHSNLALGYKLNYFHPTNIPFKNHPTLTLTVNSGLLEFLRLLFPKATIGLRNSVYAAIQTKDLSGKSQTLYLRRIFADLMMRGFGVNRSKGYVVETLDGDPFNLCLSNLNILEAAQGKRRNSWLTHYLVGLRLEALSQGICPDLYLDCLIAEKSGDVTND